MSLPDGFEVLTRDQLEDVSCNVGYVLNEFSPFCDPVLIDRHGDVPSRRSITRQISSKRRMRRISHDIATSTLRTPRQKVFL
jgi:hypothetical protein